MLIPVTYNDGSRVPKRILDVIEDEIFIAFGGCTSEGEVKGSYRMSSGEKRTERLLRLAVVLGESELDELRNMTAKWGTSLRQEAMYLEITDARVEFISPNGSEE